MSRTPGLQDDMEIAIRVARRMAARLFRGGSHRGRFVALAFIALGVVIAVTSFNVLSSLSLALPTSRAGYRTSAQNEPVSTAAYLHGQQTSDARLVWESYSDRVIQNLQQIGVGVDDTQRQLDRAKQVGVQIKEIQYIGGYPLATGSMQFYLVGRTNRSSSDVAYMPYTFTLDASGKIDKVE